MNIEIFLGVICAILLYVAYETLKLKKKQKEYDTKRKQRKAGSPRKGNRKANRTSGKAANIK
tara:strand:- start:647 stop:832 length:186 start_codon:yes stop_codon:yes gene_type:complete